MKALLIIDMQNDFLPGGALPVRGGDEIVSVINHLLQQPWDYVVATKDWHPEGHGSFAETHHRQIGEVIELGGVKQILWPKHCVENTPGADFPEELDVSRIDDVVYKGTEKEVDSYSGFFDNDHKHSTGLDALLKAKEIDEVFLVGVATDYCVKYTALDAVALGYKTTLVVEGCRGVELHPGDTMRALKEMEDSGVLVRLFRL